MASLTGQTIAATYTELLRMGNATLHATTGYYIKDSADTNSALSIAQTRVGIGTSAPEKLVHIGEADTSTQGNLMLDDAGVLSFRNGAGNKSSSITNTGGSGLANLTFGTKDGSGNSYSMVMDTEGNVGIGNAVPTSTLHVEAAAGAEASICRGDSGGSGGFSVTNDDIIGTLSFKGYDDTFSAGAVLGVGTGAKIVARANTDWNNSNALYAPADLEFYTQTSGTGDGMSSPRMVISKVGFVGIADSNPGYPLEVHGDGDDQLVALFEQDHATGHGIAIKLGSESPTATDIFLKFIDDSTNLHGYVKGNGDDCTLIQTSDRRLKENIVDLPNALSMISQIKPRTFTWKSVTSDNNIRYGFIADEFFEVFPHSVDGQRDSDGKLIPDAMTINMDGVEAIDRQGISTDPVIPVLVKAVQELSAKVTALENNNEQTGESNNGESNQGSDNSGESSSESSGEDSGGTEGSSSDSSSSSDGESASSESSSDDGDQSSGSSGSDASDDSEAGSGGDDSSGSEE
jgi:hypothetical protein